VFRTVFSLFLIIKCLFAQPDTLFLGNNDEIIVKDNLIQVFEDTSASSPIEEVLKYEPFKGKATRNDKSVYWIKFLIKNEDMAGKRWIIEALDPHITSLSMYEETNEGFKSTPEVGSSQRFLNRPYKHKNFIFNINVKYNKCKTYYFRLESKSSTPFIFKIRTNEYLLAYSITEYYLLGFFYGILSIIAVYNFIILLFSKEISYLFYVLYVIACGLTTFNEDGIGFQFLWPNYPEFNIILFKFAPLLLVTSFVVYSFFYLDIKPSKNPLYYPIILCLVLYIVYKIYNSFYSTLYNDYKYQALFVLPFALVYFAAIWEWKNRNHAAPLFVFGYTFIVFSSLVIFLRSRGLIIENIFTVYSLNFSFVVEVVILSIALTEKFNRERKEREKAQQALIQQLEENQKLKDTLNRELEAKVEARTKALALKNEELKEALNKLEEMNQKLIQQNQEIEALNHALHKDNQELKLNLDKQAKARLMFENVSFEDFMRVYPDEESCLKYLSETKWKKGYFCRRCKNCQYFAGRTPFSRRCTRCGYEESATAYTILHGTKIPLQKAFYMVYLISTRNQDITSDELSKMLSMRQKTCWRFKNKIILAINKSKSEFKNWGDVLLEDIY
jgi:hypothetical protein